MRQLNKWQNAIFLIGAVLMVAGAVVSAFRWPWFPYVYAVGAIGFACMQMLQRYDGPNFTIRRLRRIMVMSDVLFLLTAVLMFAQQSDTFNLRWLYYLYSLNVNWVVVLLLAAVLQLYSVYRIDHELQKEAKKL